MAARKIELMHELFGCIEDHKCGDCANFISGRYRGRILQKCKAYGLTHSEATDWAKSWGACGIFNREYHGKPIIEAAKHRAKRIADFNATEGQISMDDFLGGFT